ncbi:MAG: DUF1343 domain-containing protein [Saprospiraceae bacterium]
MKLNTAPVIECGIDRIQFYEEILPKNLKYGLLSNRVSINKEGVSVKEVLIKSGYNIVKLFSPEHGYNAQGIDGQSQPNDVLANTSIPVISLYGDQLKPSSDHLKDLDAVIIDLPNIGARYYTYLWTMVLMMEVCNEAHCPVIILDRPNPLGGDLKHAEGPIMHPDFFSFIGNWSIPIRFSLTLGELALLIKKEKKFNNLGLKMIAISGWSRWMNVFQYQYPFVPPSPAIREPDTIFTYTTICYLEATNISEGRGTPFPFQIAVAPWINGDRLQNFLAELHLPGVMFETISVIPEDYKFKGQDCHGIKLKIIDINVFKPVSTGFILLATIKSLFPDHFQWKEYPTVANPDGKNHFQKLTGNQSMMDWLNDKPLDHLDDLDELLKTDVWSDRCAPILLYD